MCSKRASLCELTNRMHLCVCVASRSKQMHRHLLGERGRELCGVYGRMHVCIHVCTYACMYVGMYVCVHVCVCNYVSIERMDLRMCVCVCE